MDGVTSGNQRGVQFHVIRQWRRWFAVIATLISCLAIAYWYEAWVSRHLSWQRSRIEAVFGIEGGICGDGGGCVIGVKIGVFGRACGDFHRPMLALTPSSFAALSSTSTSP